MTQMEMFKKEHAMKWACQAHGIALKKAREVAVMIAKAHGQVSVDDIRETLPAMEFGNWAGSIFKDGQFYCSGYVPARHAGSHGRLIRVWKLKKV